MISFLGWTPTEDVSTGVVVIPAPYEATTSYGQGTARGPAAILEASHQVEFYDEELQYAPCRIGIATRAAIAFGEATHEAAIALVAQAVAAVHDAGQWPLVLGGEHSITSGCVRGTLPHSPGLGVLQIDAHADLRNEYDGSPWSHASVMRRIVELGCPTVGVGIRALCEEEAAFIRERQLPRWFAHQLPQDLSWIEPVIDALPERVFLTVDVDGLDPSLVRATGTPVPGGIGWYPLLALLRTLFARRTVVGADIVELAPQVGDHPSDFTVARLAYKLIGYYAERHRRTGDGKTLS
ncbi:MAG: agmatinase [Deltaproteobacteria bacterium]|nr:agmatinase [Deltaproteobacteria bacterium]